MGTKPESFYLPFVKKEKIAKDTYSFYFDSAKQNFSFLAGQYVDMILPIKNPDYRGSERSFTIASSPLNKKYLMITTKIMKSSFKKALVSLKPDQAVEFNGPWGEFVFKEEETFPRVFLAGGIGITPFHSTIAYAHSKILSIPITLFVSFSRWEDVVFYKELSDISKENPNVKIIYTITHPDPQWKGETGRISEGLMKKYVLDISDPRYYIVGPPNMVADMEEIVVKMGVPSEKIFIENFSGY